MAAAKCTPAGLTGFFSLLVKAVICGWLVNIAVLLALCADDLAGKFMGVWFPMMTMMATGHEFAVANMMMIPAGILVAAHLTPIQVAQVGPDIASLGFSEMWINLIGVSIGNLLGGILFAVLIFGSLLRPNFYKT
jgi:formate/nitrite transporter FocA (FNT family)